MALRAKVSRRNSDAKEAALDEATKEETKRLNLDVPISLHSQLKVQAAQEGRSMKELVMSALDQYLSE